MQESQSTEKRKLRVTNQWGIMHYHSGSCFVGTVTDAAYLGSSPGGGMEKLRLRAIQECGMKGFSAWFLFKPFTLTCVCSPQVDFLFIPGCIMGTFSDCSENLV